MLACQCDQPGPDHIDSRGKSYLFCPSLCCKIKSSFKPESSSYSVVPNSEVLPHRMQESRLKSKRKLNRALEGLANKIVKQKPVKGGFKLDLASIN